jgi:hypothetical protein
MPKRLNLRNRCCPKCGGKIGVIRRATKDEPLAMFGCVDGSHVQVDGTYGYDADHFPLKKKSPSKKEIDKFIQTVRYPKFASFVVMKLVAKFGFTREQAVEAWKAHNEK